MSVRGVCGGVCTEPVPGEEQRRTAPLPRDDAPGELQHPRQGHLLGRHQRQQRQGEVAVVIGRLVQGQARLHQRRQQIPNTTLIADGETTQHGTQRAIITLL